jgi:hypothetical protein
MMKEEIVARNIQVKVSNITLRSFGRIHEPWESLMPWIGKLKFDNLKAIN